MIEKMARAAFRDRYPEDVARWEDESPEDQLSYQGNMRAAVEAMMEPSDIVLRAGDNVGSDHYADYYNGPEWREHNPIEVWQAMLRAILDEK